MNSHYAAASDTHLLLLAPSVGFGGGIERVAAGIEESWPGQCSRVDLYRRGHVAHPRASALTKAEFLARATGAVIRGRPEVVLALHVGLLPVAVAVAKAVRARLAMFALGGEVFGPSSPARRAMIARCSTVLAISTFTARVLAWRTGIEPGRIVVVPLAIDKRILSAAQSLTPPFQRRASLLTVSRLSSEHRYKGHFAVAESFSQVLQRRPYARWIVVGDGDDLPVLRAHCRALGLSHAVSFEAAASDKRLIDLYATASGFVLPSVADFNRTPPTGEGFGLVYAEAGAFGVPAIASSAAGGAGDIVIEGETGLTVPPDDREALAAAMQCLLDEPEVRDRLGQAARKRVFERHTPTRFAHALSAALGEQAVTDSDDAGWERTGRGNE